MTSVEPAAADVDRVARDGCVRSANSVYTDVANSVPAMTTIAYHIQCGASIGSYSDISCVTATPTKPAPSNRIRFNMPDARPRSLALTWSIIRALAGPCAMFPVSWIRSVTTSTMMNELTKPSIRVDAHIPMSPTTTNGSRLDPVSLLELMLSDTRPANG